MIIYVVMFASMLFQLAAFMLIVSIRDRKKLYGDSGVQGPRGADGIQGESGRNYDAMISADMSIMNIVRGDSGVRGRKGERGHALWDTQEFNHHHSGKHTQHDHLGSSPEGDTYVHS